MLKNHVLRVPQVFLNRMDFRSDTVTVPSPSMIHSMSLAEVGDDVYGEDKTVNSLQDEICKISGKEKSLFVVSGTMSNQIAIQTHLSNPPYSVICDSRSHVYCYEASGISFHTGALVIPIRPQSHSLTAQELEKKLVLDDDVHHAPTKLICLENTLNGTILPFEELQKISKMARKHNIPIHLDGARLWNASIATGISIKEYAEQVDSVSLCFSKGTVFRKIFILLGLGAPIGSILIGNTNFIKRANHLRKLYGGGWRQAGYLARACQYSLNEILPRLSRDHEVAQTLKTGLIKLGLPILYPVDTNMVWTDASSLGDPVLLVKTLKSRGIIVSEPDPVWRLVIHHQISSENVMDFLQILETILLNKKL